MSKDFTEFLFEDIVSKDRGFLRGPFGGNLKKEIFVPKAKNTYKVYEQGVVLRKNINIGRYNISEDYFNTKMNRFEVFPKDFLVSCSGANYGAIFQMPDNIEKGVINQALLRIRLNNNLINDKYFDYFFSHHLVNQIIGKKGDSTIPNFPPVSVLKKLKVKIHSSIDYQKQIAKVLSDLDAKIEINTKINTELEAMAKTLYDYWFVQFDFPFDFAQGKPNDFAQGKPDKNSTLSSVEGYKSSGGTMVFNEELKREIPEGWESGLAKDLFHFNPTLSIKKGVESSYIDMNALPVNGFMTKKVQKKAFGGGMKFQNNDVVIARITPCLENGKTGLISLLNDNEIGFGSTEFIVMRGINSILKSFISCLSRSDQFRKHAISKMTGTSGRKRVKAEALENYKMPIPPKEIIQQFEKATSSFFDKMTTHTKQNQKLAELRDWLLPMLMNGQVSVGSKEKK